MYNPGNSFFPSYGYMIPNNFGGPMMGFRGIGPANRGLAGMNAIGRGFGRITPMSTGRGLGLFRGLSEGMGFFKNINWGSLFNNTSRALGVVNQALPIVKQAGPMFNNMRSMLKVASIFKDVTDGDKIEQKKGTRNVSTLNHQDENTEKVIIKDNYDTKENVIYNNSNIPNFFI